MPENSQFDELNPKNAYRKQKASDVERVPATLAYPRFEPVVIAPPDSGREEILKYTGDLSSSAQVPVVGTREELPTYVQFPLNVMPDGRCNPFYRRRITQVPAMRQATVLRIEIRGSGTYYLHRIGHNYNGTNFTFELGYDGKIWDRWNYQLGALGATQMYTFPCALAARDYIQLIVYSRAGANWDCEVAFDGWWTGIAGIGKGKGRD